MAGTLYIVATPIGNLGDITLRAIETLKSVDVLCAEDSRVTSTIKKRYDIEVYTLIYHHHSSDSRKQEILNLLLSDKSVALVTDAGTPGISDPGNELIDFILQRESSVPIVPIPGSSALTAALSVSGMNVNQFVFLGFLPKKKRTKLFDWLEGGKMPFAFYESPHRLVKTLEVIKNRFGAETPIFVARELTKMHETLYRGSVDSVLSSFQASKVKGELVVLIDLYSKPKREH